MRYISAAVFAFVLYTFCPVHTEAALLYLDPTASSVARGDTITMRLRLDTDEGECINTVDAVLQYEPGIRAVDVSRGNSILNIWVEEPKINETDRTITLAAGIIGGYCGRAAGDPQLTNVIADIVFQSPGFAVGGGDVTKTPTVSVRDSSSVLLNDGFGSLAQLRTQNATITLLETAASERTDEWRTRILEDTIPPGDFGLTLTKEDTAFSGKYFIVWNTQDKQSGIDHYEVMEEPLEDFYAFRWGRADAPWVRVESPYVLEDQTLNSTIRVKAIDKAGNETIAVFVPDEALRKLSFDRMVTFAVIAVVSLMSVLLVVFALIARKRSLVASYETNE